MSSQHISAALRRRVAEAARFRCGCCLTSQHIIGPLFEIEHIIPEKKGGGSEEENLFLACPRCNGHKSDRVEAIDPVSMVSVPLFNPRVDFWKEHFEWIEGGTVIQGKTPKGRATVAALKMNDPARVAARSLWVTAGWHPPMD